MINKFLSLTILALISAFCVNQLTAQTEEKVKVVVIEKTIDENGDVKETKVIKEGAEAKAYMEEMNISDEDVYKWTEEAGENEKQNTLEKRKIKIVTKDDSGNEDVIVWEGKGDMPDDIRQKLEENDIDIINEEKEISVTVSDNMSTAKSKVMIINNSKTNEEVFEFDIENGEMPEDIEKLMEEKGIDIEIVEDGDTKTFMIVTEDDDEEIEMNNNKAQLGVFLESADEGAKVIDTVEGSAAEGAGLRTGDVITKVGEESVTSMQDVVTEIGKYEPNDIIIVHFIRDDVARSTEVTLKKRDPQNRTRTVTVETMEDKNGKQTKRIEKRVIIKEKK